MLYAEPPKVPMSPPLELSTDQGIHELGSEIKGVSSPASAQIHAEGDMPRK